MDLEEAETEVGAGRHPEAKDQGPDLILEVAKGKYFANFKLTLISDLSIESPFQDRDQFPTEAKISKIEDENRSLEVAAGLPKIESTRVVEGPEIGIRAMTNSEAVARYQGLNQGVSVVRDAIEPSLVEATLSTRKGASRALTRILNNLNRGTLRQLLQADPVIIAKKERRTTSRIQQTATLTQMPTLP